MTTQDKYTLAQWAIDFALANGANDASVSIANSSGSNIEVRDQKIDKLEQAIEKGLTINLYVNQHYASAATNKLDKGDLEVLIKETIDGAQYLSEDEFRQLPSPEFYYQGDGKDLKVYDPTIHQLKPEDKIKIVKDLEAQILGSDKRIISITTSYFDGYTSKALVTSNGFKSDSQSTYFGVSASVSVKSDDARPEGSWYEVDHSFAKLDKKGASLAALHRALDKIGQEKAASETLPMLVDRLQVSRLLSPLISALSGGAIQQKNSFLLDKLGQKVVSDKLTLVDNPHILGGRASRHFDGEGMATKKRTIFENGILKTYFFSSYYANKMELIPTTGNSSNITFELGEQDRDSMIKGLSKGILITGFNGGNSNPSTGDFSFGIEGFLIEEGKITKPINEMNITGNMLELWNNVEQVGNDAYEKAAWQCPSILFKDVSFSGK